MSPNYPSPYPGDTDCTYTVRKPEGVTITLKWEYFYLEPDQNCNRDYVKVGDVTSEMLKLLLLCGHRNGNVHKCMISHINVCSKQLLTHYTRHVPWKWKLLKTNHWYAGHSLQRNPFYEFLCRILELRYAECACSYATINSVRGLLVFVWVWRERDITKPGCEGGMCGVGAGVWGAWGLGWVVLGGCGVSGWVGVVRGGVVRVRLGVWVCGLSCGNFSFA